MNNVIEVKKCITHVLIPYAKCFGWTEFGDYGGPCYKPYKFSNQQEEYDAAITRAAVLIAMPKGSREHIFLGNRIAELLNCEYVTYDWLVKVVGRVLSGTNYNELKNMASLSAIVQKAMKRKGLTQINSIQEALS